MATRNPERFKEKKENFALKILFIGDIMGRPGRVSVRKILPGLIEELNLDFVIANGENIAGGKGITPEVAREMFQAGIDVLTGGNHSWQNREGISVLDEEARVLRPANYPTGQDVPGRGSGVYTTHEGHKIAVINLQGRIFMNPIDCPFQTVQRELDRLQGQTPIILVDFHAEATSEKIAMGWFIDGKVSALIGTHTHVITADEQILPGGTAYLTDAGMTGAHDGVIGIKRDLVLTSMLSRLPIRHKIATGDLRLNSVLVDVNPTDGKALSIKRITRGI